MDIQMGDFSDGQRGHCHEQVKLQGLHTLLSEVTEVFGKVSRGDFESQQASIEEANALISQRLRL